MREPIYANRWYQSLQAHQADLKDQSQYRSLLPITYLEPYLVQIQGKSLINLSSNDYLAIATHPLVTHAASQAALHATGGKASRLAGGERRDIHELEERFAHFKKSESALLFPTGYMANLAVMSTLTRPYKREDQVANLICMDKYCHASLIDGARLSGQTLRTYPHGNQGHSKLIRLLKTYNKSHPYGQGFIVTDSVFSMDGDCADLQALGDIAFEHDAILIVDEAHGTGIYGTNGSGVSEAMNIEEIPITVSTASKALGGMGGLVTGKQVVIDQLINEARALIYTTSPPPSQVAAIDAALTVIEEEPWRRERVMNMASKIRNTLKIHSELNCPPGDSPIIPLITGSSESAIRLSEKFKTNGFLATPIRPPTVPPNLARVRLSLRADLPDKAVERLIRFISEIKL